MVGIDEAGRGALAGPIVAAGVRIIDTKIFPFQDIADSKKLTPKKRRLLIAQIENSSDVWISALSNRMIDRIGIQHANVLLVDMLVEQSRVDRAIVDYIGGFFRYSRLRIPVELFVNGEDAFPEIAAASIVAKVWRDDYMESVIEKKDPRFGFVNHKGYGTAAHITAIRRHGLSPFHRTTFTLGENGSPKE